MRLFAAVTPPEHVLDHLDVALGAVRGAPAGTGTAVRWSARETWHLTLAFFGELPDGAVPALADDLAVIGVSTAPYELRLRGAGVFAHRTVWVGVSGDVDAQRDLSARVREAGESAGAVHDDRRRDRPHLTVGRARVGARPQGRRGGRQGGSSGPDGAGGAGGAGRSSGSDGAVADALVRALAVYEGPTWSVDRFELVRSTPGAGRGGGPLYATVGEYRFGS